MVSLPLQLLTPTMARVSVAVMVSSPETVMLVVAEDVAVRGRESNRHSSRGGAGPSGAFETRILPEEPEDERPVPPAATPKTPVMVEVVCLWPGSVEAYCELVGERDVAAEPVTPMVLSMAFTSPR